MATRPGPGRRRGPRSMGDAWPRSSTHLAGAGSEARQPVRRREYLGIAEEAPGIRWLELIRRTIGTRWPRGVAGRGSAGTGTSTGCGWPRIAPTAGSGPGVAARRRGRTGREVVRVLTPMDDGTGTIMRRSFLPAPQQLRQSPAGRGGALGRAARRSRGQAARHGTSSRVSFVDEPLRG